MRRPDARWAPLAFGRGARCRPKKRLVRAPCALSTAARTCVAVLAALSCASASETEAQTLAATGLRNAPWTVRAASGAALSMRAVRAYRQENDHFLDPVSLFEALGLPATVDGHTVRAAGGRASLAIDFEKGTATYSAAGVEERTEALSEGGVLRDGARYLLSLPNLRKVLPPGALAFDEAMLTVMPSAAAFGRQRAPFRLERPAAVQHAHGPLLYGRTRKFIGGTQLSYRMTRSQRPAGEANYNGFLQLGASALGGHVSVAGTLSRTGDRPVTAAVRSLGYVLDFPGRPALTRAEIGRSSIYQWPVRQSYDGIRLGNLPLSTRHLQHPAEIKGVTEPHALVAASVDGVVVDQAQADNQGRYALQVPARYGTSQAEVEISPAGGGLPTVETRRLFIAEDLAPPGKLYWDLNGGRSRFGRAPFGLLQARLGLSRSLTARGGLAYADSLYTATLGATRSLWGFMSAGAEVSYPEAAGRATLGLFRGHWRINAEMELAEKPGLTHYRRRLQGQIGASLSRISLHVNAGQYASFAGGSTLNANASGTLRLNRGTTLLLSAGRTAARSAPGSQSAPRLQWKSVLTRYLSLGRLRTRTGLQGEGGRYGNVDFAGLTANANLRNVSFGTRIGYDFAAGRLSASLTLRMDAPWMSFNSHSELDPHNPHHRQSVYGAMELGHGIRFTRQPRTYSSAVLRAFIDLNRNSRMEPNEPLLPELELEVLRARVSRQEDGSANAGYLLPSTRYEVVIDPGSIKAPNLVLATGTIFSFVSDPGETKRIDIPVYRNTAVEGAIEDLPLDPPTRAVVVFFQEADEVAQAAVSPQRTFTAVLAPGTYRMEVHDVLTRKELPAFTRTVEVLQAERQTLTVQPNRERSAS